MKPTDITRRNDLDILKQKKKSIRKNYHESKPLKLYQKATLKKKNFF